MANISVSLPSDGETVDVADYNTPINTIVNEINGSLDNSNITAAAAIAGSKLADASLPNAKLATGAGEPGGAWTSWTPSLVDLNAGTTGVVRAIYTKIGNTVHFQFNALLGGTGISVGDIRFSVPINASSNYADSTVSVGTGFCRDGSSTKSITIGRFENAAEIRILQTTVSGSYTTVAVISATTPHTWGAGDVISLSGTYESV